MPPTSTTASGIVFCSTLTSVSTKVFVKHFGCEEQIVVRQILMTAEVYPIVTNILRYRELPYAVPQEREGCVLSWQ